MKYRIVIAGKPAGQHDHFKTAEMSVKRQLAATMDPRVRGKVYRGPVLMGLYGYVNGSVMRITAGTILPVKLRLEDGSHQLVKEGSDERELRAYAVARMRAGGSPKRVYRLFKDGKQVAEWRIVNGEVHENSLDT